MFNRSTWFALGLAGLFSLGCLPTVSPIRGTGAGGEGGAGGEPNTVAGMGGMVTASTADTATQAAVSSTSGGARPYEGWYAYDFDLTKLRWSKTPLPEAFKDVANPAYAAPTKGWLAATYLADIHRLLIVHSDGFVYQMDASKEPTWMLPKKFEEIFPCPASVKCVDPGNINSAIQLQASYSEGAFHRITFVANPNYSQYRWPLEGEAVEHHASGVLENDPNLENMPDREKGTEAYAFNLQVPERKRTNEYSFQTLMEYNDGKFYQEIYPPSWAAWPLADAPMWKEPTEQDKAEAPAVGVGKAAYTDRASGFVRVVGP